MAWLKSYDGWLMQKAIKTTFWNFLAGTAGVYGAKQRTSAFALLKEIQAWRTKIKKKKRRKKKTKKKKKKNIKN